MPLWIAREGVRVVRRAERVHEALGTVGDSRERRWDVNVIKKPIMVLFGLYGSPGRVHEAPGAISDSRGWRWGIKVVEVPHRVLKHRSESPRRVCE